MTSAGAEIRTVGIQLRKTLFRAQVVIMYGGLGLRLAVGGIEPKLKCVCVLNPRPVAPNATGLALNNALSVHQET